MSPIHSSVNVPSLFRLFIVFPPSEGRRRRLGRLGDAEKIAVNVIVWDSMVGALIAAVAYPDSEVLLIPERRFSRDYEA